MLILFILIGVMTLYINFINTIICIIYLAMIWFVSDIIFWIIKKITNRTFNPCSVGWIVVMITLVFLFVGWHQAHHVFKTEYTLTTNKNIPELKIAFIADSHIGTTFDANGFKKHLEEIQKQNPDLFAIVGDFVDDSTTKEDMIQSCQALGKLKFKHGTYFVFGNHDKGYYGSKHRGFSAEDLQNELIKNGVQILRDEIALIDNSVYLIGRKDYSENRKPMKELIFDLNPNRYTIVLDHQPTDYENQEESGVDLVLSGHTHGGQLFPFNQMGKWIGASNAIYGHEKRGQTSFIVTSGISDWAIRFKTGTQSEYAIIYVK